ncbi:multidrug-resistance transporter mdr2 [Emmonsiellopsis sp. PD_5]|nr:multidrug-resistance transporter mdr2 [Emmonsiellopsis sp. PD_5]
MRSSALLAAFIPRASSRRVPQTGLLHCHDVAANAQRISLSPAIGLRRHHSTVLESPLHHNISRQPNLRTAFTSTSHVSFSPIIRRSCLQQVRFVSDTKAPHEEAKPTPSKTPPKDKLEALEEEERAKEAIHRGFERTEKASQAAQINLSARLAKDGQAGGKKAGFGEIWRLLKIARPEAKILSMAFLFLLISSSITMSIPFSIGKILDIATNKNPEGANELFGLTLPVFYGVLAGVLALGAAANYGRIIILRIVGERIVARLRSKLFRRTYIQDAEFFDANRVGDLISRLSSDTIIVGKSITQNLSDGLRAAVSGAAGFGLMAYVSLKLSSILALLLPPVALGAFFYGRSIRNLSRKIQKNLGSLTKIAEERLGNVKTSQSFAGEILEVHRYNKQVRRIFELGKRESFISATFFSTVGN